MSIMGIVFSLGVVGAVLAAFFAAVDFRARGPRYLSTLALAAAVLAFSGWNLWGYKPPRKPKNFETVKNRVVQGFDNTKATRLEITRLGKTVTFDKKGGKWLLTKPVSFPADQDAVENLLTEIKMVDRDKLLPGPRTKAEYGFGKAPIVVKITGATSAPLTLTIGGKDVTGAKVYLARNQDSKVRVVNKHFRDAFDKDPGTLRDTTALHFRSPDVKTVQLTTAAGKRATLTANKKVWSLRVGAEANGQRANAKSVEDLIRKLQDLRATTFLGDGAAALKKHGLTTPQRTLVVNDGTRHELLLGGPCPGQREDRVAGRRGRYAAAFCLRAKELSALLVKVDDLRDARLVGMDEADVESILIQAGGREVHLKKVGIDWEVQAPKNSKLKKASVDQVEAFIKNLRTQTVLTFLPPPAEGLAKYGLDKPRATLTLRSSNGRTEKLLLGQENADKNFYAQRSGEKLVVVIHREAGLRLSPSLLQFRDRNLLSFAKQPNEAVEITTQTGPVTEQVVYEGGLWQMKKPLSIKADGDALDAMLSVLSQFKVERFVSETPLPQYGLAQPTRTVKILLEKEDLDSKTPGTKKKETHTLRIGKDAPKGGCYGQLDGPGQPVFLLRADPCRDLRAYLASRRLAEVSTSQIRELKLTRGGGVEHLERRGAKWGRKGGPLVSSTAVEGLLTTLASMRATRVVSYGPTKPAYGLARPTYQVEIGTQDKAAKPVVLKIGSAVKENNKVVGHYAMRADRQIVYLLGLPSVEAIQKAKF